MNRYSWQEFDSSLFFWIHKQFLELAWINYDSFVSIVFNLMLDQFTSVSRCWRWLLTYLYSGIDNNINILSDCSLCPRLVLKLPSIRRKTRPLRLPFACRPSSRLQFVPTLWASFTTKWPKTIVNHMLSTVMLVSWKIILLVSLKGYQEEFSWRFSDLSRHWVPDILGSVFGLLTDYNQMSNSYSATNL